MHLGEFFMECKLDGKDEEGAPERSEGLDGDVAEVFIESEAASEVGSEGDTEGGTRCNPNQKRTRQWIAKQGLHHQSAPS